MSIDADSASNTEITLTRADDHWIAYHEQTGAKGSGETVVEALESLAQTAEVLQSLATSMEALKSVSESADAVRAVRETEGALRALHETAETIQSLSERTTSIRDDSDPIDPEDPFWTADPVVGVDSTDLSTNVDDYLYGPIEDDDE